MPSHFSKVLLGGAVKTPFLDHLDCRVSKHQTDYQFPPHDKPSLVNQRIMDNTCPFQGAFARQ